MLAGMRLMLDHDLRKGGLESRATKAPPTYVVRARERLRQAVLVAPKRLRKTLERVREDCVFLRSARVSQPIFNLTAAAQTLGVERAVAKQLLAKGVLRGQAVGGGPRRVLNAVDKTSLDELVAQASSRVSAAQLAERYGIKSAWILDIAALGFIERAESAFINIAYRETQLRKSSATAYLDRSR